MHLHLDLGYFGGHARHILRSLRPSQPVVADEEIVCWGNLPKFFDFFAFCDVPFFVFSRFCFTFGKNIHTPIYIDRYHHFYFPAQLVGGFTLSDLLDKPWSQVSSLPPGTCLHFYRA